MSADKNDQNVLDCYAKSLDILLKGRKAQIFPCRSLRNRVDQSQSSKLSDYCVDAIAPWRIRPTSPLFIDIFLVYEPLKQLVLIERWLFRYVKEDARDTRAISNRRIQTFIRSLYSFVRLLPGFQLLSLTSGQVIYFDVYGPERNPISQFSGLSTDYKFPVINAMSKTTLHVSASYLPPVGLQSLLRLKERISSFYPRNNRHERHPVSVSTAPIPIVPVGSSNGQQGDSENQIRGLGNLFSNVGMEVSHSTSLPVGNRVNYKPAACSLDSASSRRPSPQLVAESNGLNNLIDSTITNSGPGPGSIGMVHAPQRQRSKSDMVNTSGIGGAPERQSSRSLDVPEEVGTVSRGSSGTGVNGHVRRLSCPGSPEASSRIRLATGVELARPHELEYEATPASVSPPVFAFSDLNQSQKTTHQRVNSGVTTSSSKAGLTEDEVSLGFGTSPDVGTGISPPFARSSVSLISTSPQTATVLSVQRMREVTARRPSSNERSTVSSIRQAAEYSQTVVPSASMENSWETDLKRFLPPSPFDMVKANQQDVSSLPVPSVNIAAPFATGHIGSIANDSESEEDEESEDMPFAWAQPDSDVHPVGGFMTKAISNPSVKEEHRSVINSDSLLIKMCLAPPPLSRHNYIATRSTEESETAMRSRISELVRFRQQFGPRLVSIGSSGAIVETSQNVDLQ